MVNWFRWFAWTRSIGRGLPAMTCMQGYVEKIGALELIEARVSFRRDDDVRIDRYRQTDF
ncbi:MAG: hypothetical protein M0C28_19490 [Candidatus Moduliflexus flocculans]|nr:hypothetical protein [Candidatus Moduliflexus flocculans]